MNETVFIESGLKFTFNSNEAISLEKSDVYSKELANKGIKIVDLFVYKSSKLSIIEIKKSAPKELSDYISDIKQKFNDSFLLLFSIIHNRIKIDSEIITDFLNQDILSNNVVCVLIVDVEKKYLPMLQNSLNKQMNPLIKIFNMERFLVYNFNIAKSIFLIENEN